MRDPGPEHGSETSVAGGICAPSGDSPQVDLPRAQAKSDEQPGGGTPRRPPQRDGVATQAVAAQLPTTQLLGTVFDGVARHTAEGYAFQRRAAEAGFKQAVRERDEPFGDFGPSTYKG